MSNLQHINMPVILTSCIVQFLPINHPWKPVCKRRKGHEETQIFIVCRLCEILFVKYPGDTTALCWREKCSWLSLHCWLHLLLKARGDPIPAASTRVNGQAQGQVSKYLQICYQTLPFWNLFWCILEKKKKINPCSLPALEAEQNPYLCFIKRKLSHGNYALGGMDWVTGTVKSRLQVLQLLRQIIQLGYRAQSR